MSLGQWFLLAGFAVFAISAAATALRVGLAGRPADFSQPRGRTARAIMYSLTGAMLPWRKESARRHPAVYALGAAYHAGTFLAFLWLVLLFFGMGPSAFLKGVSAVLLAASVICGLVLLLRRFAVANLRYFSSPDDYFANVAVTVFQVLTAATIAGWIGSAGLFTYAGPLLVYVPFGKLRHSIYFPFARLYLGLFYGRRGVWAARGERSWRD